MIHRIITSVFLIISCNIFLSVHLKAEDTRKIAIAVPEFILSEGISESLASSLADILKTEFDSSSKILTKGPSEINNFIEAGKSPDPDNPGLESGCQYDEECAQRLGRKMQVDYVTFSRISTVSGLYLIEVRLISISGKIVIPPLLKGVQSREEIADMVRLIGSNIAIRFPLEGSILAITQNGRNGIINLGAVNNLKSSDEFYVMRETVVEGFKDRRIVGTLSVLEIQEERSKAEVKSGRGDILKGDLVILNQEELIKKLEEERLTDEVKLAELKQAEDQKRKEKLEAGHKTEEARSRESRFARSASFIRAGYSGFGLLRLGETGLNEYYTNGFGIMADIFFYRIRTKRGGNGFDFYSRYAYRQFEMTGGTFAEFQNNYPALEYGKSKLQIHSVDLGGRLVFGGYFLFSRIDLYLIGGLRQAKVIESAENRVENTYLPTGITGGGGIEFSFYKRIAFFAEYNYGYLTVGENKDNIDGHQVFFGVSLRTDHI